MGIEGTCVRRGWLSAIADVGLWSGKWPLSGRLLPLSHVAPLHKAVSFTGKRVLWTLSQRRWI